MEEIEGKPENEDGDHPIQVRSLDLVIGESQENVKGCFLSSK